MFPLKAVERTPLCLNVVVEFVGSMWGSDNDFAANTAVNVQSLTDGVDGGTLLLAL